MPYLAWVAFVKAEIIEIEWARSSRFNLFIFVSLQTIKTSNPSILKKKKEKWKCSQVKRKKLLLREHGTLPSYSGNMHTLTHTYRTSHHVDTEIHILIPRPHLPLRFQSYEQLYDMMLGFFSFFSRVMHIWTSLLCIDLDPAAGFVILFFFSFVLVFFLLSFGAWEGWVRADFTFLVLLLWLFSVFVCFSFIIITLIVSLASSSSSVVHHPSKDRAAPPVFCLILCRMNFWWLEKSKFSSSSSFVFYLFILCHMASKGTSLPPTSPFSIQHREMNGNKIFSCHHPFLALCRQPHSVSRKLCVRMTPPCRPFRALPRPHPLHPVSPHLPSFSLSAYTCLFECRWHKKTFIATKYICFSILSVAPSRRHLWHALLYWTVPQLCRLTSNPLLQPSPASAWIWLASIFTLCFFFPPIRPSTRLLHVSVCVLRGGGGLPPAAAAPPSEASCVRARACCLCQCSVCVCQTSLCCPLCVLVLCLCCLRVETKTVKTSPCPLPPLLIPRGFHERANRANPVRWLTVLCVHLQNCRFKLKKAPRAEMRARCEMLSFGGRQISRFMISFHGD